MNQKQTLVFEGKLGVGKTTMMQGLLLKLDDARDLQIKESNNTADTKANVVVASVFFDAKPISTGSNDSLSEHAPHKVLMYLVQQFLDKIEDSEEDVEKLCQRCENMAPTLAHIRDTLISMLQKVERACIFIDALDECLQEHLQGLLPTLKCIQDKAKIGLVFSDRVGISRWRSHFPHAKTFQLSADPKDVSAYLEKRCIHLKDLQDWWNDGRLQNEVTSVISKASGGM